MHKSSVPKSKVKVLWLCSRSQPGIKVIIRDLRGHLLHTVTFLVFSFSPEFSSKISPQPFKIETSNLVYRFATTKCIGD